MTKIKICGLMTEDDIRAVNDAKPDLAGFIFASGRHQITLSTALDLRKLLNDNIPSVGVFVNAPIAQMLSIYDSGAINLIQLHGQESEETIKTLQSHHISVIKVFKPETIRPTAADYLMLDSGAGNGQLLDLTQVHLNTNKPVIIAGALNIDNVASAIAQINPNYVDLSRGVETNGVKDPQKISKIVKLVHQL